MKTLTKSPLKSLILSLLLIISAVFVALSPEKTLAATKTYGYSSPNKNYMYNQAANWWGVGDGSAKNGSAINAFAAAMSVLYGQKITPAAVAKVAYEKNYWNLSGTTPSSLIRNLTTDSTFNGSVITEAAGSSTSVRLSALAKSFTKSNVVVIARATGSNPFKTSESGGHYILILAYKSDGTCLVYDPAQASASPKWGSAKTLFNQMKSNIMFYAIAKGSKTTASSDSYFTPAKEQLSSQDPADEDGETTPEDDPFYFEESEDQNLDCEEDPFQTACEDESSTGEPAPEQAISTTTYALNLTEKAITAAWPVINGSSATCYDSKGKSYDWIAYGSDYHNQSTCGRNVRSEYTTMLNSLGVSYDTSEYTYESWRERAETFFAALFKAAGIKTNLYSYLSSHSLTEYLNDNLTDLSETINNVNRLAYGDIIISGGSFYIYTGDKTGSYGNVITSKIDVEGPHVERYSGDLTDNSTKIYRLKEDSFYGAGSEGSGEFGVSAPSLDDEIPESEQTEAEQGIASATPSETIAARAMSFAWPYTKYSTDDSTLWGKCVKKYNGAKTKYSTFPKSQKKFKLSTYPTGTSCNKVLPAAYANFKGITGNSAMNSANVTALGFVKNVYKSLGVSVPYNNISDLKNELGSTDSWELITNNATKETDFQPGDLLVSKDSVAIYVGDYGDGYGTIVQAYYKKWTPRVTPLYLNKTYVFRLKSSATVSEDGANCPELDSASASGNNKIAIEAVKMSWPNTTGDSTSLGKCETTNGSLVDYPEIYKYTYANTTIKTSTKSLSTLTSERKKAGCTSTTTSALSSAVELAFDGFVSEKTTSHSDITFAYAVLKAAGVKRFEPNAAIDALNTKTAFENLKHDTDNWTVVSKKLTSTKNLQPGDIIIAAETVKKKIYSHIMIYVGDYGKDCTGKNYGNVVDLSSSETPHLQPIYYKINNSSSRMNFWVFRAKESAYEEINTETPGLPDPEIVVETTTSQNGDKIAIRAVEFSWPFTKYSTGSENSKLNGKCIRRGNSGLATYPVLSTSAGAKNLGGYAKDESYTNTDCNFGFAPLYLRWISNNSWTLNDMLTDAGVYDSTVQMSNAWSILAKGTGGKVSGKNDCIGFVRNVLKSLGMSDIPDGAKSAYNNLGSGKYSDWKLVGTKINVPSNPKDKDSPPLTGGVDGNDVLKPGDLVANDHHIFIFVGEYGGKWGNRADADKNVWWGGHIHSIYTYDSRVYNSGNNRVFRYIGKDI